MIAFIAPEKVLKKLSKNLESGLGGRVLKTKDGKKVADPLEREYTIRLSQGAELKKGVYVRKAEVNMSKIKSDGLKPEKKRIANRLNKSPSFKVDIYFVDLKLLYDLTRETAKKDPHALIPSI